ncbi:hypothetical protein K8I61_13140 [bacterium]|nr:hypothetical protein [bacterium]
MKFDLEALLKKNADTKQYRRVPGLFRRWELEHLIEPGFEYFVEEAGKDAGGAALYALFCRELAEQEVPR